jgi:hypothetical protein
MGRPRIPTIPLKPLLRKYPPPCPLATFSICWCMLAVLTVGYRGEKPFQALESKLMSTYISKTLPKRGVIPLGYIDFHSYSQEILYPFAYDCSVLPRDAEDLAEAAWGAAKAARNVHGRYFDVDSACEGDNFAIDKVPSPSLAPLASLVGVVSGVGVDGRFR